MNTYLEIVLIYMVFMSVVGFCAMGIDKAKAKADAWRIPEKTLFGIVFLGGGAGVWLGMNLFRHKTKHWYFKYGMPAILILQIALVSYFVIR